MKILTALIKTIRGGPCGINHFNGGLLRYYTEEALAKKIDDDIKSIFKIDLMHPNTEKTAGIHFLVYFKNMIFFYQKYFFTFWYTYCAHYKFDVKTSKLPEIPPILWAFSSTIIFCYLVLLYIHKVAKGFLSPQLFNFNPSNHCNQSTEHVNLAIQYFRGLNPSKKNDLFLISNLKTSKKYKCFIIASDTKKFKALKEEITRFGGQIKSSTRADIDLIPWLMNPMLSQQVWQSTSKATVLWRALGQKSKIRPLVFLSMILFNQQKTAYVFFLKTAKIDKISTLNFSYNSSTISAAAFEASVPAIFKEVSVWGDWSSVYCNRVICNSWVSLTKQSSVYAKKTQLFVDNFTVSKRQKPLLNLKKSTNKETTRLKVFIIGTNSGENDTFFVPQQMPIKNYQTELYSFFSWAKSQKNIEITIKEKKNNSEFYKKTCGLIGSKKSRYGENIHFIENPQSHSVEEFSYNFDAFIALGTFYPSSIYELANHVQKERLFYWDICGLTKAFPEVLKSNTMNVCTSLDQLTRLCSEMCNSNDLKQQKSMQKLNNKLLKR